MPIPQFSETILQRYANPKSFQRGEDYYRQGAVRSLTQRGQLLLATVEGNETYQVSVQFEGDKIIVAHCTCPYDFDGWCKHIIATLLTCMRQPAKIEERPTLEQLLDCLNEVQTQRLIQELVAEHPELLKKIDRLVNRLAPPIASPQASQSARPPIDTAPYRNQVSQILRDAVRYLEEGWEEDPVPEELYDLIAEAQMFAERGEGNSAIAILEAITQACVENWDEVEEYGADNDEVAQTLNVVWTEAILVAELTPPEKDDLQINLESWQDAWNADFAMSLAALRQGWDYPPLQRILQGEISQSGVWEAEKTNYADDLALIRLKILESQQKYQEYLYLAEAEGQTEQFLIMLARLDRIDAVMEAAKQQLSSMEQALALAQVLLGQGATSEALQIAQGGLFLPGNCQYELANWTSELAEGLDEAETALAAKIKAFQARPTFTDYHKLETLAGENWAILKEDLLDYLRSFSDWGMAIEDAKVNIFLHEALIEDAIAVVSDLGSYQSDLIHRVMAAAISNHPDWVIENSKRRAEAIMDAKKAEDYDRAVEWLRKARTDYYQAGRKTEWSAYRTQLMQSHARKYKLMGLLKHGDLE